MHGMVVYEYAVIRVVPRVERDEFLNVGIILYSKQGKFIKMFYHFDEKRLSCFSGDLDLDQVKSNILAFEKIANGEKSGGPIACEDQASRFRWLTAVRSSVIQTSRPHPGMTTNLENEVERLFKDYVL